MIRMRGAVLGCMIFGLCLGAQAELQTITVGGEIQIRGSYWDSSFAPRVTPTLVGPELRIPGTLLVARPIGDAIGGQNATSHWDWDDDGDDYKLVEQRTTLNLCADFTEEVSAFIEIEAFQAWGTGFRSNYLSGIDGPARAASRVNLYQAYIETREMFGTPIRVRIGRQELNLGEGWLVGDGSGHPEFAGLSFDGIRATYETDAFQVDAFWTKLLERTWLEQDGDVDFSGIYGTYKGFENIELDAYWLWVRDARNIEDNRGLWFNERLEDWLGVDNYGVTNFHTLGARAAGLLGSLDFAVETAYQFGDADQVGRLFKPFIYGDDDATYDQWAADAEIGYTFDTDWQPRVYAGGAYLGGEDNRSISFWQWINPVHQPEASVSFSRLFSNRSYSPIIDEMCQLTNVWTARTGVNLAPTENVHLTMAAAYFQALDTFDQPPVYNRGLFNLPLAGPFTFWTWETDDTLGWEASFKATYDYSDDLEFELGWHHFFADDGLTDGNYTDFHGLLFSGGTDDEDSDYVYVQSKLKF